MFGEPGSAAYALLHSEPQKRGLKTWAQIAGNGEQEPDRHHAQIKEFMPTDALVHWVKQGSEKYHAHQPGQIFRGLTTIYFPGSDS